jgi:hypothetical protein
MDSRPPMRGRRESELLHHARTQHLLRGRACSRQTKLLAHGYPSAIWGGRCSASFIGLYPSRASSRNRHAAMPLPAPACNGAREPMTWDFAGGCSITHLHPSLGMVTQPTAEVLTEIATISGLLCCTLTRHTRSHTHTLAHQPRVPNRRLPTSLTASSHLLSIVAPWT